MLNFKSHILYRNISSSRKFSQGFTLIEMLVVFAIIGSLTVGGVNTFFFYSQTQSYRTAVSEVSHLLATAKTRAISQVKPTDCATQDLRAYQVSFTAPGSTYKLEVVCGGNVYPITTKNLPSSVTFTAGSASVVSFAVRTGIVSQQQTITIVGNNTTKSIIVDTVGNVTVQ